MTSAPIVGFVRKVDIILFSFGISLIIFSVYLIRSTSYRNTKIVLPSGKILVCSGMCKYKTPHDYFWLSASSDMAVVDNSYVFTSSKSSASVELNSGNRLSLYPNSMVLITKTRQGSKVEIIEGKVNIEKKVKNSSDTISIKGKDISVDDVSVAAQQISAVPELLEASSPEEIELRESFATVNLQIKNGKGPFKIFIEDQENINKVITAETQVAYKIQDPGVYSLRIEDSSGNFVTKMIKVIDVRAPQIKFPKSGDFIYVRSFKPFGDFLPTESEILLEKDNQEYFKGAIDKLPLEIKPGSYSFRIRKLVNRGEGGSWSDTVNFTAIATKSPEILTSAQAIFFNRAQLSWKNRLPVAHTLTIKDFKTGSSFKLNLEQESFVFDPKRSGKFSWELRPVDESFSEKIEAREFQIIGVDELVQSPADGEKFSTDGPKQEVNFTWLDFPKDDLKMYLEIKDNAGFQKKIDISEKSQHKTQLPALKKYYWRLVVKKSQQEFTTQERTLEIDAPPALPPIKGNEINIKEKDVD